MRQRRGAVAGVDRRGAGQDRQFRRRPCRVVDVRRREQPRAAELAHEQRHARILGQRRVVGLDAGAGEEFADGRLVHVAVLAQVEGGKMEAEHVDRAPQRGEPPVGEQRGAVPAQRRVDGRQVGREFARRRVRREPRVRTPRRRERGARLRRRHQPRVEAHERLPVRLVGTVRIVVPGRRRKRQQRGGRPDQPGGQRKFAAQRVHLAEIVREGNRRLRADRVVEHRRGDEGIAVAVAADPRTHAEERRQPPRRVEREGGAQLRVEGCIQPGHLGQEGVAVVRQAVVDLVLHLQARQADHRRLPQLQDAALQPGLDRGSLVGGRRHPVAPIEQPRDRPLGVEDALALHLGRVRGQHRRDDGRIEPARDGGAVDAFGTDARQRVGQAAPLRRRTGQRVRAAPAVLVDILGEVGEVREIAERADDVERLPDRQRIEQRLELGPHGVRVAAPGPAKPHRGAANCLDAVEAVLPRLFAQHVAEHATEQPGVVLERLVLVGGGVHWAREERDGGDRQSIVAICAARRIDYPRSHLHGATCTLPERP